MGLHIVDGFNEQASFVHKPLSLDGKNVHMTRKDGSSIDISLDRFSKQDQELLSQAYSAETREKRLLAEREAFHDAVKKALETFPGETSIKQAELREDREQEFLQAYDGTEFYLVFPIVDISPTRVPGCYTLHFGNEQTRKAVMSCWQQAVKLSATDADLY